MCESKILNHVLPGIIAEIAKTSIGVRVEYACACTYLVPN